MTGLEPGAKEYHVWDRDMSGFGLRVHPTGKKVFVVQWRDERGKQHKRRVGAFGTLTPDEAREKARGLLAAAELGISKPAPAPAITFEQAVQTWLAEKAHRNRRTNVRRKTNSIENDKRNINIHAMPVLRGMLIDEITTQNIETVRNKAEDRREHPRGSGRKGRGYRGLIGGPYAASRVIRTLKSVFAYAEDRAWIARNPTKGVRLTPDNKREVYLTTPQVRGVVAVVAEARAKGVSAKSLDIIMLWLLTGCRRRQIEQLTHSEVDLDAKLLRLKDTKTGKVEKYLTPLAVEILARQKRMPGNDYVFPGDRGDRTYHQNAKKVWNRLKQDNWPDVRPHDLRHTFASQLIERGADLQTVRDLMGHSSIRSTERYAHLTKERLREAVQAVELPFHE